MISDTQLLLEVMGKSSCAFRAGHRMETDSRTANLGAVRHPEAERVPVLEDVQSAAHHTRQAAAAGGTDIAPAAGGRAHPVAASLVGVVNVREGPAVEVP